MSGSEAEERLLPPAYHQLQQQQQQQQQQQRNIIRPKPIKIPQDGKLCIFHLMHAHMLNIELNCFLWTLNIYGFIGPSHREGKDTK